MIKKLFLCGVISLIFFTHTQAAMSTSAGRSIFDKSQSRVSLTIGSGRAFQDDYIVLGLGVGYFIANGFEIGLDGEAWWGGDRDIYKLSPETRYIFNRLGPINPFVGAFYKRTFYEGLDDLDSYGGRLGAYVPLNTHVSLGFGYVFEQFVSCDDAIYSSCSTDYPEISITAGF